MSLEAMGDNPRKTNQVFESIMSNKEELFKMFELAHVYKNNIGDQANKLQINAK